MKKILAAILILMYFSTPASAETFGTGENEFEIEFVEIGDPGNASDVTAGAVDYVYNIGKFEISRSMVEKANDEGGLEITLDPMEFVTGGPRSEMPATGVRWGEAARFANWLNTSQGFPVAYKFGTQPGDEGYDATAISEPWVDGDFGFDSTNPLRNSQARYFLPSRDEWYKAAYYDPAANDGEGGYWEFPNGSDTAPMAVASGTEPNTAVYLQDHEQGPADIMQAGGLSPFGVMGFGGNVWEWDSDFVLVNDNVSFTGDERGGSWSKGSSDSYSLSSRCCEGFFPESAHLVGFRVASIPEPNSNALLVFAVLGLVITRRPS